MPLLITLMGDPWSVEGLVIAARRLSLGKVLVAGREGGVSLVSPEPGRRGWLVESSSLDGTELPAYPVLRLFASAA